MPRSSIVPSAATAAAAPQQIPAPQFTVFEYAEVADRALTYAMRLAEIDAVALAEMRLCKGSRTRNVLDKIHKLCNGGVK